MTVISWLQFARHTHTLTEQKTDNRMRFAKCCVTFYKAMFMLKHPDHPHNKCTLQRTK